MKIPFFRLGKIVKMMYFYPLLLHTMVKRESPGEDSFNLYQVCS